MTRINDIMRNISSPDSGKLAAQANIRREGRDWWLVVSDADGMIITMDRFSSFRKARTALEETEPIFARATRDESRRMFGTVDNAPHGFRAGSVRELDYARS